MVSSRVPPPRSATIAERVWSNRGQIFPGEVVARGKNMSSLEEVRILGMLGMTALLAHKDGPLRTSATTTVGRTFEVTEGDVASPE
jgi:hypothetical protein